MAITVTISIGIVLVSSGIVGIVGYRWGLLVSLVLLGIVGIAGDLGFLLGPKSS